MPSKASRVRFTVVLKLPQSPSKFIVYANAILTGMTNNSWFPKPTPSLGMVKKAIAALEKAQAATLTGKMGKATARNDALLVVRKLLQRLASYVQTIADAHPDDALTVIHSAGMSAKRSSGSRAHTSKVKRLGAGSARVTVPVAGDRATYRWQKSLDGGKTWIDEGETLQSTKDFFDLPRGVTVLFRHKTITTKGESDWIGPIEYFVT